MIQAKFVLPSSTEKFSLEITIAVSSLKHIVEMLNAHEAFGLSRTSWDLAESHEDTALHSKLLKPMFVLHFPPLNLG